MNTRVAAAAIVALAIVFGGVAYYFTHTHQPSILVSVKPIVPSANGSGPIAPIKEATIYTVSDKNGDSNGLAPERIAVNHSQAPARDVLQALIDSPNSPLPSGTKLQGIRIEQGLATVDFSKEFRENFHGGDLQEAQAINSILMTLGQFSTIDRVQITVDGAAIDSLGGHFEISTPVDVIRPASTQQANDSVEAQSH